MTVPSMIVLVKFAETQKSKENCNVLFLFEKMSFDDDDDMTIAPMHFYQTPMSLQ